MKQQGITRLPHKSLTSEVPNAASATVPKSTLDVRRFRNELGLSQGAFAPLLNISIRKLSSLEGSPGALGPQERKSLTELRRLVSKLEEVVPMSEMGHWLTSPNGAFGGFKPVEVIERGEVDRLYEMVYVLTAGVPG